jgi:hypothetical protein
MHWKILLGFARLAFGIALAWMLFGRPGKRGYARVRSDGRIEFAPDWIGLCAYPLVFFYLLGLATNDLLHRHAGPWDFLNPALLGSIAITLALSFPGTVVADDGGLEAIYWFRRNKRIRWKDVESIETDGKRTRFSMITLAGVDGTKINHSSLLADRPRLLLEIQKHCTENLPPDFPREPVES